MAYLTINGRSHFVDTPDDTPLLWAIREELQLTGTKYGCGAGLCGSCTVHVDGVAVRSCQIGVGEVGGKTITTIEGLHHADRHAVQQAWLEKQVPQCGYCQSGQIMQAAAFIATNRSPSNDEIVAAMDGNLCRCATYNHIVDAVRRAAEIASEEP
jgi:isoquinoline 1-oxidoreductase alpha subunit